MLPQCSLQCVHCIGLHVGPKLAINRALMYPAAYIGADGAARGAGSASAPVSSGSEGAAQEHFTSSGLGSTWSSPPQGNQVDWTQRFLQEMGLASHAPPDGLDTTGEL